VSARSANSSATSASPMDALFDVSAGSGPISASMSGAEAQIAIPGLTRSFSATVCGLT